MFIWSLFSVHKPICFSFLYIKQMVDVNTLHLYCLFRFKNRLYYSNVSANLWQGFLTFLKVHKTSSLNELKIYKVSCGRSSGQPSLRPHQIAFFQVLRIKRLTLKKAFNPPALYKRRRKISRWWEISLSHKPILCSARMAPVLCPIRNTTRTPWRNGRICPTHAGETANLAGNLLSYLYLEGFWCLRVIFSRGEGKVRMKGGRIEEKGGENPPSSFLPATSLVILSCFTG